MRKSKLKEGLALATSLGMVVGGLATATVTAATDWETAKLIDVLTVEKEAYERHMDEIREDEISLYRLWKNGEITTDEYKEMLSALSFAEYVDNRTNAVMTTVEVEDKLAAINKEIDECNNSRSKKVLAIAAGAATTVAGFSLGIKVEDKANAELEK